MRLGWPELIIILVIVVAIFGAGKVAGIGKALGKSIREFKQAKDGVEEDVKTSTTPASKTTDVQQTNTKA